MLWRGEEIGFITNGSVTKPFGANGISIDTRTLMPNELFIALAENRDGHDFILDAIKKGASGALVSKVPKEVPSDFPLVIVDNVFSALNALGAAGRARISGKVIAVTGSVGKTSTKEMLKRTLSEQFITHASENSYNNHWGVPLTLAKMPPQTEIAILEIGMNNPGEILPLAEMVRPDIAIVTNVTKAHLASFDSLEKIIEEKFSILKSLRVDGVGIINGDIENLNKIVKPLESRLVTFGESEFTDWTLSEVKNEGSFTICSVESEEKNFKFKLKAVGNHFAINATAVFCAIQEVAGDLLKATAALSDWKPFKGRGERSLIYLRSAPTGPPLELVDESYNASPASVKAGLLALKTLEPLQGKGCRRIAILGDMKELGKSEMALHQEIENYLSDEGISHVHCVGALMKSLHNCLPIDKKGLWVLTADELVNGIKLLLNPGDIVMVKGSLSMKMDLVVAAIKNLGHLKNK
ncbi:MAG: UDP-N-acetylmuramoyl-tripeptide--D-alanyl-D-alanine ligase [Paracoccaceae bacterium]